MAILKLGNQSLSRLMQKFIICTACLTTLGCSTLSGLDWIPFNSEEEPNAPVELTDISEEVEIFREWSVNVGNGQGNNYNEITPAIDGGYVFAASENGDVVAVNSLSGDVVWRVELEDSITGGVGAGDDIVMAGTRDAEIVVLNQSDGVILWRSRVSSEVLSQPQTNGDVVVAQTVDGKLVALDRQDGTQRWTYETTLPALTLRGTSSPIITPEGSVIAGFSNGVLVSVAAEDGVWAWEERVAVPEGEYDIERVIDIDGDLLLDGSRVLASSYQGNIMAFDIQSGRIVWGMEASSYHGLDQGFGNLYFSDDKSHLVAIRDNSDDVVWQNENLEYRSITAPRAVNNYVAVADFEGYLHLISQIDGRIVGRTRIDNDGVRANIIADDGTLIVFGNSGTLTALTLQ
ncbi:MAG: outer membrane protein assembly factor BamB [Pseudomonadales bacterium]|nr:outer membrane protein assembly factor BamB [Pseudomonadales bacterium]